MNYASYSTGKQHTAGLPAAALRVPVATLAAAALAFIMFDINSIRNGLSATKAGLQVIGAYERPIVSCDLPMRS